MKHILKRFSSISHIPDFQTFLNSSSTPIIENFPTESSSKTLAGIKYYIQTYGCQMNENDSEIVGGILKTAGLEQSEVLEDV
jgi:tRNA-2-methylthio-N6-dimethylallyladenosine synthase